MCTLVMKDDNRAEVNLQEFICKRSFRNERFSRHIFYRNDCALPTVEFRYHGTWHTVGHHFWSHSWFNCNYGCSSAIPITYGLKPETALILLSSILLGQFQADLYLGLINMPGTPSSIATTFDAYPMSKRGETARAMAISLMSSFLRNSCCFLMIIATYSLVQIALKFGPFEYFALGILAFAGCMGMMEGGIIKNALGFIIGLLLARLGQMH